MLDSIVDFSGLVALQVSGSMSGMSGVQIVFERGEFGFGDAERGALGLDNEAMVVILSFYFLFFAGCHRCRLSFFFL